MQSRFANLDVCFLPKFRPKFLLFHFLCLGCRGDYVLRRGCVHLVGVLCPQTWVCSHCRGDPQTSYGFVMLLRIKMKDANAASVPRLLTGTGLFTLLGLLRDDAIMQTQLMSQDF